MIRIKKLLIYNFKGIKDQIIVDFQKGGNYNQILSGPNGFGKTTIFEAIELCITGKFDRIQTFKDVQLKNRGRKKPFFQNTDGKDVVIKLLFEREKKDIVITKIYDDVESPKRVSLAKDFIPEDSHSFFFTYLTEGNQNFNSLILDSEISVNQSRIDELFLGHKSKVGLESIYYLFNYIQQEESIRFLKQREDEKGASLAFLFSIEKEEAEQSRLDLIVKNYMSQKVEIGKEIEKVQSFQAENEDLEYRKLFDKGFGFDQPEPFRNLDEANSLFPSFVLELDKLISFRTNFDVAEYDKSRIFDYINNQILNNEVLLNSLLISNIYSENHIHILNERNAIITNYNRLKNLNQAQFISKENIEKFFDEEQQNKYGLLESQINSIDRDLGEIGLIISNLISANETVWEKYKDALDKGKLSKKHCPLCNSEFDDIDELTKSFKAQVDNLKEFNQKKIDEKQGLILKLGEYHQIIQDKVDIYLESNLPVENSVIAVFRNYPNEQAAIGRIKNNLMIERFGFSNDLLFATLPNMIISFDFKRNELKQYFESIASSQYKFDTEKIQNKELYGIYFDNKKELFNEFSVDFIEYKKKYLQFKLQLISNKRHTFLKSRLDKLTIIVSRLQPINKKLFNTIKEHKIEMIEKIKIPFFIYSGKILQNYQQGFGIFIDIQSTGQRNNVVLKTGRDSDHDIVFHLSAGQMAVVSLAFCLSLNKVYNTNDKFKFLAIDDPIKTMDNLNIHSFIELLRNEFRDYQIILSTHDDFISRYISYKFEKYNMTASVQNVQELILDASVN